MKTKAVFRPPFENRSGIQMVDNHLKIEQKLWFSNVVQYSKSGFHFPALMDFKMYFMIY
jgi:hypothetical protein